MKGFIFVLDESSKAHFINVNHIVMINGANKAKSTEIHLTTNKIFITKVPVEEIAKLIENSK